VHFGNYQTHPTRSQLAAPFRKGHYLSLSLGILEAAAIWWLCRPLEEPNIEFSCAAASPGTARNAEMHSPIQPAFKATTATICYA